MADFTKRRRSNSIRRFAFGVVMLAVLGVVTFGATRAAWGMYGKFAEAASANEAAQQNLTQMKAQKASVQAQVDSLGTPEGQEAQLRQSYGVALPGEGEIQIVRQSASTTAQEAAPKGGFFARIFHALFVW